MELSAPIQIYLHPTQLEELQALADRWQVAVEEVVRQGLATFLTRQRMENNPLLEGEADDDLLRAFTAARASGPADPALAHADYLIEFEIDNTPPPTSAP